jgi:hypothetical protein
VVASYLGTEHEVVMRSGVGQGQRGMAGFRGLASPLAEREQGWLTRTQERWS